MVKHTQATRRLLPTNYLSVFDHFKGLALKRLRLILELAEGVENNDIGRVDRILQYDPVGRKNFNVNGVLQDSLLHKAARNRNYEICKMLVKFGAG